MHLQMYHFWNCKLIAIFIYSDIASIVFGFTLNIFYKRHIFAYLCSTWNVREYYRFGTRLISQKNVLRANLFGIKLKLNMKVILCKKKIKINISTDKPIPVYMIWSSERITWLYNIKQHMSFELKQLAYDLLITWNLSVCVLQQMLNLHLTNL